jgi:hypothetical protein
VIRSGVEKLCYSPYGCYMLYNCKLVGIRKRGLKLDEWKNTASHEPFDL